MRYELGRWTLPVLASLAAVVAVGVGILVGMLIRWFTESSSARPRRKPAASGRLAARRFCSVSALPGGAAPGAAGRVARGPARGRFSRLVERSTYLSLRCPISWRMLLRKFTTRFLYGSFVDRVRRGDPVPTICRRRDAATLGQTSPPRGPRARLGAGPFATFRRVTMPLARPGVLAAIVLVFVFPR